MERPAFEGSGRGTFALLRIASLGKQMATQRPIANEIALLAACDTACESLTECDWLEAFRGHPRIGETGAPAQTSTRSASWSRQEQRSARTENDETQIAVAEGNRAYEQRFRRTFIIVPTENQLRNPG